MKERVKYYSNRDLSSADNLRKAEVILKNFKSGKKYSDINDVIELYQIRLFFENKLKLNNWSISDEKYYESLIPKISDSIKEFWIKLQDNTIEKEFQKVEYQYHNDFWSLISIYKTYNNISDKVFLKLLKNIKYNISDVLQKRKHLK